MANNTTLTTNQSTGSRPQLSVLSNRIVGVILLLIFIGILFVYGYNGQIRYIKLDALSTTGRIISATKQTFTYSAQLIFGQLYIITTFFVVLGFSCIFIYYKKATATALFTVLFIVSLTILLSPLLQKFWFNVFITNFNTSNITLSLQSSRFLESSLGGKNIFLDFYNLKISLANVISQLVVILIVYGKLSINQMILQTITYNISWNLNYFLCVLVSMNSPDHRIFDDYQITCVYLFGGIYGTIISLLITNQQLIKKSFFITTKHTSVMSLVGSFFLFLSFCGTTTLFSTKHTIANISSEQPVRGFIWQEAFISSFFALSASVIFFYAFSILLDEKSRINVKGSIIGIISGGIMYGCIAGTCPNIAAGIASGLFAGFISAFSASKLVNNMKDSFGGKTLMNAAIWASFFIAPIVIIAFYNNDVNLSTLWGSTVSNSVAVISNKGIAGWILAYVGISIGIGLVCGFISGLLLKCLINKYQMYFYDAQIFKNGNNYGLKVATNIIEETARLQSAQELKGGNQ